MKKTCDFRSIIQSIPGDASCSLHCRSAECTEGVLLVFSRMRSEGFPFIVGVWGWTCVRFVLLPRRRLVVANSSRRRRQLVNSLPLGGTFALRHNPYLQSVKSGGSLARNARFGVVVVSSSRRRRQLVNSLPLGGTFALRHNPYLQSVKSGGSLARNALFGGVKSQNGRSFSCFA